MTRDQLPVLLGLAAWLVLAVTGLARLRLSFGRYLRLGMLWSAIILTAWAIASYGLHHG